MSKLRLHRPGYLLAWLALALQLALGALIWPAPVMAGPVDEAPICHTDTDSGQPPPSTPHHAPACLVCPLCASVAVHWVLPASAAPALPPVRHAVTRRAGLPPPSIAPPAAIRLPSQPRAPPALQT